MLPENANGLKVRREESRNGNDERSDRTQIDHGRNGNRNILGKIVAVNSVSKSATGALVEEIGTGA
jgi:hypothetical protein